MRRVPLLAMLAVLVGVLVAPSTAAPSEGIVLRGSRTAYVDLYVYTTATVTPADLVMKTAGSFVGFFLSPAPANRPTVGALVMPRVGATGADADSVAMLGESWDVKPGRYRAFLLTDGAAEVFVPIAGQGFRGWSPRGKAPLSVRRVDFDVPAGSPGYKRSTPMRLGKRSLVVAAGLVSSASLTAVDSVGACVTVNDSCAAAEARLPTGRAWASGAKLVPPGEYDAMLDVDRLLGHDAGSHVDGAVLVLTIGRQT